MDKTQVDTPQENETQNEAQHASPSPVAAPTAKPDFGQVNVGAYNPELSKQAWEESKLALKDTPKGRAVIRMFSRGVMGATGFVIGGHIANTMMKGYAPHIEINPLKNPVQGIARAFDVAVGKPLKAVVNLMGRDGEAFVNSFRPTARFENYKPGKMGRSLGHEAVMVTFDFATMSIGDFWGRKIVHTLDPKKQKPSWRRDDGGINWSQAIKTFGHNWWAALTYSAGEDWAVAVPYCLTMRHIGTPALNSMFPGYKYEFDRNGNGGGMLVNEHGKITGNMTVPGVLNLWERFTTYNVGTLMFREAYHWTGNRIKHWWKTGDTPALVEANPEKPNRSAGETVVDGVKQFSNWVTRSTAKAVMYMIPSVPFFWITRTPQHKFQGAFIHPEKGAVMFGAGEGKLLRANTPLAEIEKEMQSGNRFFFSATQEAVANPLVQDGVLKPINPNAKSWGMVDTAMNPIAKAADAVRGKLRGPIGRIYEMLGVSKGKGAGFADTYINASMAYTPYFWAKSDWLADKWDYGRTDAAVDRTIAGAVQLNPGEFKAGLHEIGRAMRGQPLPDPIREKYAQCLIATDATPSDNKFDINPNEGQSCDSLLPQRVKKEQEEKEKQRAAERSELNWRERIVAARPEDKPEVGANNPKSYAEREEMRKLLEQLQPPTSSIN